MHGGMINRRLTPEGNIKSQIRQYLKMKGWFVVNMMQGPLCHRGIADLYCIKNGRSVWIEVKTSKGTLSTWQKQFQDDIEEHVGVYIVARSLDDVIEKF